MGLETGGQFISDFNEAWPVGLTDFREEGDDHIRLIKRFEKQTWVNISGAVNATHTELNALVGFDTSTTLQAQLDVIRNAGVAYHIHNIADVTNLQANLNAKAPLLSPTFVGTPTAPTPALGTSTAQIATMAAVQQEITAATLPSALAAASFFPVNAARQMPITNTESWNVGYELTDFPADKQIEIAIVSSTTSGTWVVQDLRTNSAGYAKWSSPASTLRATWLSLGGSLGVGILKVRPIGDSTNEFSQTVNVY